MNKLLDNSFWSNGLCVDETKVSVLIFLTIINQFLIGFLALKGLNQDISNIPFDTLKEIQFVLIAGISSINLGSVFSKGK